MDLSDSLSLFFKKKIFKNVLSLGVLQIANSIIPLIVIPFVVRTLGSEEFGRASYAQNIIAYFTLLINYGFEYSATQDVALYRENKERVRSVFWTVMKFKFLLLLISFVFLFFFYLFVDKVREDPLLYVYASLLNVGMVFYPSWFFQGMEKLLGVAFSNVIIRLLCSCLVLFYVQSSSDCWIYILLMSMSYLVMGVFSFFVAIVKYDLSYCSVWDFSSVKKGFSIFLNNIFTNLYALGGLTVVGIYLTNSEVGTYSGVNKIVVAICMLISMPISVALFPKLSRSFAASEVEGLKNLKRCILYASAIGLSVFICVIVFAPLIVKIILGPNFDEAVPLLRCMSIIPFLVLIATMLTIQGMYGMQMQKYAPIVGAVVSFFGLLAYFILIPRFGVYGAAAGYVISEIVEIIVVFSFLRGEKVKGSISLHIHSENSL